MNLGNGFIYEDTDKPGEVIFENTTLASLSSGGYIKFKLILSLYYLSVPPSLLWFQSFVAVKKFNRSKL